MHSLGVTEATLTKTEEQLALLEDLVKDSQFDSELKDCEKKFIMLQDQKFAELEKLKSNCNQQIFTYFSGLNHDSTGFQR